jgi:ADP-heptose:LPS heptosyltransferase
VKIVLTRLDRIGDLILSTPAIGSVRRSWPEAHITLVCSRHNAVVVERNPDIDRVLVAPSGARAGVFGRQFRGACDVAIALAPRAADLALVGATGAPVRVGYTYARRYLARLTARLYLNRTAVSQADPQLSERSESRGVLHEVDEVLALVRLAGGSDSFRDLVVPVADLDRHAVDNIPANGIALHLGPRWSTTGSTLESTIVLLAQLKAIGVPVVVTYGVESLDEARRVRDAGVADAVVGGLSFGQWAAVFEKSRIVVTVDTGATHVASAMRRATVVVFEDRYFNLASREWAPYRVPSQCLRKPVSDSPANLAGLRAAVVAAVESLLK